jgi:predicted secreted hydrolase
MRRQPRTGVRYPGKVRGAAVWALVVTAACWFAPAGVDAAGPPGGSDLDVIRSTAADPGFELVLQPRTFEFPRDHGPHPQFRHEWWYVTGNLDSSRGERFGFELTFFRVGLRPPQTDGAQTSAAQPSTAQPGTAQPGTAQPGTADSRAAPSAWHARQLYTAHFAITDVAQRQFRFAEKFSRDALGLAGAQAQPFRVWLDDWMLGTEQHQGQWKLHAAGPGYELTLQLEPLLAPVLNGEQGLSRKGDQPGAASYYYSIPRVAVHGQLSRAGTVADVRGLAWLDREWGTSSLAANQQGWDWFALQLQDGSALMLYDLRNRDGSRDPHSAGTWVDSTGRKQLLTAEQLSIEVLDHWISPAGGRYPSRWRVRVPAAGLDLEVSPALSDQELRTRPRYWEGAVDVHGTHAGKGTDGRGYVELVGYAE